MPPNLAERFQDARLWQWRSVPLHRSGAVAVHERPEAAELPNYNERMRQHAAPEASLPVLDSTASRFLGRAPEPAAHRSSQSGGVCATLREISRPLPALPAMQVRVDKRCQLRFHQDRIRTRALNYLAVSRSWSDQKP